MTSVRTVAWTLVVVLALAPRVAAGQAEQPWLRDRGPGVRTSLLGTYVRHRELLVYPFFEWYSDHDLEYKPVELGYGQSQTDYRGRYTASEGIFFLGYGVTPDLALEFEAAVIDATLETSPSDTSAGRPPEVQESGLGDVEGQIRWRFKRETATGPELFTFVGAVLPLQQDKHLIGTQSWEYFFGVGLTRGFGWGTLTVRTAAEYADNVFDAGEYAVEYMRQLSPAWRVIAGIEGTQVDEVSLLTEAQWHIGRHAIVKLNHALGLTQNAVDFAPEVGLLIPLGGNR
jgi:hypothetical protein